MGVTIPQLNYGELELGKELGVGGGGVVYQARYYGEALGEEWGGQDGEGIQVFVLFCFVQSDIIYFALFFISF